MSVSPSESFCLYKGAHPSFPELSAAVRVGCDDERGRVIEAVEDIPPGAIVCVDEGTPVGLRRGYCRQCLDPLAEKRALCDACGRDEWTLESLRCERLDREMARVEMSDLAVRVLLAYDAADVATKSVQLERGEYAVPDGFATRDFDSVLALQAVPVHVPLRGIAVVLSDLLVKHSFWGALPSSSSDSQMSRTETIHCALKACLSYAIVPRLSSNAHSMFYPEELASLTDLRPGWGRTRWTLFEQVQGALGGGDPLYQEQLPSMPVGCALFPIASIFNHSCTPTTFSYFSGRRMVWRCRGVRRGQELTDCYSVALHTHTLDERKNWAAGRGWECMCSACKSGSHMDDLLIGRVCVCGRVSADLTCTCGDEYTMDKFGWTLTDELQMRLRGMDAVTEAMRMMKRHPPSNVDLQIAVMHAVVEAVSFGQFSVADGLCQCILEGLSLLAVRQSPEEAHLGEARLLLLCEWQRRHPSGERARRLASLFLHVYSSYTTFYGPQGTLTRRLLRTATQYGLTSL